MEPKKPDPLDEPSDCYVERDGELRVLTFRELQAACEMDMKYWDRHLTSRERLANQKANDPDYHEIAPGAGLRKYKRWRG